MEYSRIAEREFLPASNLTFDLFLIDKNLLKKEKRKTKEKEKKKEKKEKKRKSLIDCFRGKRGKRTWDILRRNPIVSLRLTIGR